MGRSLKASACLWPEWAQHPGCPWKGLNLAPSWPGPSGRADPKVPTLGSPSGMVWPACEPLVLPCLVHR